MKFGLMLVLVLLVVVCAKEEGKTIELERTIIGSWMICENLVTPNDGIEVSDGWYYIFGDELLEYYQVGYQGFGCNAGTESRLTNSAIMRYTLTPVDETSDVKTLNTITERVFMTPHSQSDVEVLSAEYDLHFEINVKTEIPIGLTGLYQYHEHGEEKTDLVQQEGDTLYLGERFDSNGNYIFDPVEINYDRTFIRI